MTFDRYETPMHCAVGWQSNQWQSRRSCKL